MGSSQSISNTVLGQSLIGKKFQTKVPYMLYYYESDKKYYMRIYNNERESGDLVILFNNPIKFEVTDVIQRWD